MPARSVPSLAVQRANYERWCAGKAMIYHKTPEELDLMFSLCEQGDEIIPDFAYAFTVRRKNGLLVSINKQGQYEAVSPYSPAVKQQAK